MVEFEVDIARLIDAGELDTLVLHDEHGEMQDIEYVRASELAGLRDRHDTLCHQVSRLCPLVTFMLGLLESSEHDDRADVLIADVSEVYADVKGRMADLGVEVGE